MQKVSKKQGLKNRILAEYKKLLPKECTICRRPANQLAHLLPKSLWPEYYTKPDNLVILCDTCHKLHDDNVEFRTKQDKLFIQACKVNEQGAKRYYRR